MRGCGRNSFTIADAECIAHAKFITDTVTVTVGIAIAVSDFIQWCYYDE